MYRDIELEPYDALLFTGGTKRGSLPEWSLALTRKNPVSQDSHYGEYWFDC